MAYPELLYKGQYTLKRVLTMPMDPTLTKGDIGNFVAMDANGVVGKAAADADQFMVLRTVNANDNICTVDFSGVHSFKATAAIEAGKPVTVGATADYIKAGAGTETTKCITLTAATAADEDISVFFLI